MLVATMRIIIFSERDMLTRASRSASAGIEGWSGFDPSSLMKVGQDVHNSGLGGLWLRQALLAAAEMPELEMVVLTVDSDASNTVVPPHAARILPLLHSSKVGIEYGGQDQDEQ